MKAYAKWAAKALGAAAVAGTGSLAVGFADNSLSQAETWVAVATAVAAAGAVFGITNGEKPLTDKELRELFNTSGGDVE